MEKVSLQSRAAQLDKMFSAASKVVIAAHTHPDGDACGSALALKHYLQARGTDAVITLPESVPETLSFMLEGTDPAGVISGEDSPEKAVSAIGAADLLVCLDFNSFSRAASLEPMLRAASCPKVLIDHHLEPDAGAFDLVFSETRTSSACELLYEILMLMGDVAGDAHRLPEHCCTALMTGMTTDTNNFANSVYPSTLSMASALLDAGVDRDRVLSELFCRYRENRVRLMGHLLHEGLTVTECGVAYMVITGSLSLQYDIREGETEGFVNIPLSIDKVKMSIMLKQDAGGFFRISIRSKKGYSAQKCAAAYFHGGGHENASGGKLFFPGDIASPDDAGRYVEEVTGRFFNDEGYNDEGNI